MTTIRINCGCGFQCTGIVEAQKHSDTTGHTMHLQGEVKSDKTEE